MPAICDLLPVLPGLPDGPRTYAAHPVWAGSATGEVQFAPMPKRQAVKLWHRLRDFDRCTHQPGRHGGAVGPAALAVAHALIFDFLHFATGRLDPGLDAIARKAGVCRRTVATAITRLRELRVLHWIRRCSTAADGTRRQETNAYAVLPDTGWRGYRPPPQPPAPHPETWAAPRMPTAIEAAVMERRQGGSPAAVINALASDPGDPLAAVLASLGRAMTARDSQ